MAPESEMSTVHSLVGQPAPDFQLTAAVPESDQNRTVRLDGYRGRWLALLFYPRDFSFVCPTELTAFSDKIAAFAARDCDLMGISIDSPDTHRAWMATPRGDGGVAGLNFPLASDPDGRMCRQYRVWMSVQGLPLRGLYLIDPDGVIQYMVVHSLSVGRSADETLRVLDALRTGGLCPADWTEADGTLDIQALLRPGRVLSHYRVDAEVGRGAFGVVLSAYDLRLNRRVALKVIQMPLEDAEHKLLNEARSAASINHPNVCTIHAVEEMDGLPVIVMEFLDGLTLAERVARGFPERTLNLIGARLARGLAAAHAQHVVHGDLKPANIILRSAADPVIVDFGLARSLDGVRCGESRTETVVAKSAWEEVGGDETVTASSAGAITGTPAYMSPEQARGEHPCPASDLFSLGLILVEMLLGASPLAGQPAAKILEALGQPDFGRRTAGAVPEPYRALIESLLSPDPSQRPAATSVDEFLQRALAKAET